MATTVYVDWDVGTDTGTGTTGDPYGNIDYALAQQTATADDITIKVRGSTTTAFNEGGTDITGHSFTSLIIEPDTGYGWGTTDPQLTWYSSTAFVPVVDLGQNNITIRNFRIENRRAGSGERTAVESSTSTGCVVENCKLYGAAGAVTSANGSNNYTTFRNCLLAQYQDDDTATLVSVSSFANIKLFNCVLSAGGGTAVDWGTSGDQTNTEIQNCVFLDFGTLFVDNSGGTIDYNASDEATPSASLGTNRYTSQVVAGDFESAALANPRTGGDDFRLASGSGLADQGTTIGTFSTDMEGTSRPQGSAWDIGYHELAASSSSLIGGLAGEGGLAGMGGLAGKGGGLTG